VTDYGRQTKDRLKRLTSDYRRLTDGGQYCGRLALQVEGKGKCLMRKKKRLLGVQKICDLAWGNDLARQGMNSNRRVR